MIEKTLNFIQECYRVLDTIGVLGDPRTDGFLRSGWSDEESQAFEFCATRGKALGLVGRYDGIGNLILETPGTYKEYVEVGSHLDTVVRGGNFDGAAGIVAGLAAIAATLDECRNLRKGLRLRIWRGEESATHAIACKGSQAALGLLPAASLSYTFNDRTLHDAIRLQGFDPTFIDRQDSTLSRQEIDGIAAHFELHIEQANYLEKNNLDIGIVTSIRAPQRYLVTLEGEFDHSGATPMGKEYRKDTSLALAHILVELDRMAQAASIAGNDLVQTVGVINSDRALNERDPRVYQNGYTKVSGFCYFSLEVRSNNLQFRRSYASAVEKVIARVATEFGVSAEMRVISATDPLESLDQNLQDLVTESCLKSNVQFCRMPSGGLHDCLHLAQQRKSSGELVPVSLIFIPCHAGKSHSPEEFTPPEAITRGAIVLTHAFLSLVA